MSDVEEAITRAHHEEWARVVAALTRRYGDLDIAEDSADGMARRDVRRAQRAIGREWTSRVGTGAGNETLTQHGGGGMPDA